jgi:hypothetical protein
VNNFRSGNFEMSEVRTTIRINCDDTVSP